jgi:hypothetical protein
VTRPEDYAAAIRHVQMPDRIASLPVSDKGFPVPWFVLWIDGQPDFRIIDHTKIARAHKQKLCWVCGKTMGRYKAMTIGPMCAINRTISEPPSHRDCAVFSAQACPFLANPRAKRREVGLPENAQEAPGVGLKRNPGATAVWVTEHYRPFRVDGGVLFTFDDPTEVLWFAHGRAATRQEVMDSITSGLPILQAEADKEGPAAIAALEKMTAQAMIYLPL